MKNLFVLTISFAALVGCQTPAKTESVAYVAADPTRPASNEWIGFCSPILNEAGEVVQNKVGPNSVRSEIHLLSADEIAWVNESFADTNCKEPYGGSRTVVDCKEVAADAEGFKVCKISKQEIVARDAKHVVDSNKKKSCKITDWAADQWKDVTKSPCGGGKEFTYKFTPETELHVLKIKTESGSTVVQKLKRK